jgi:hypothetical protein
MPLNCYRPGNEEWMRLLRKILPPLVLAAALYSLSLFCQHETDGFTLTKIHSTLSFNPEWETAPLSQAEESELKALLSQEFTYLASGGQCYAFLSADGQSVIKCIKHHLRRKASWPLKLPLPEQLKKKLERSICKRKAKLKRDFNSYKLVFEELREESGLLYLHLNKTDHLKQEITLVDKLGIKHKVAADEIEFLVQRKATPVFPYLNQLLSQGELSAAKSAIHELVELVVSRSCKGIFDEDAKIQRNFGFVGSKAIFIDVGRFLQDPSRKNREVYTQDVITITKRLETWLKATHPALLPSLEEELAKL